jgi:heterodisulfide reductase subunit A
MRYPQATPLAFSIDLDRCQDVPGLVAVCKHGAINPGQTETTEEVEVGSVVLAPGASLINAGELPNYAHGVHPNVVTGLEYERIMSASGPTHGELVRPSDRKQPRKIAWIQCVGSRNINQNAVPYCSSVCCMYALKEAIITKERFQDDIEAVIFYMDMRTSGKDYELYLQRAKNDYNVRMVRCRPHTVDTIPGSEDLSITYSVDSSSETQKETFDMVVLSTGFRVGEDTVKLSGVLGVDLNAHQFAATTSFEPVSTSKPGIFVCGMFAGPKDIPETMVQASACAGMASLYTQKAIAVETDSGEYGDDQNEAFFPPERDITGEEPRVGVFICDCGENIGGVINAAEIAAYVGTLPHVVVSEMTGHGCSREALKTIEKNIREKGLNKLVIGGCSPRTHEAKFQDTARRAGLNKYLVEMANLRDQDTWVHFDQPTAASEKAKDLLRMAVSSAVCRRPLTDQTMPVNQNALVVGGGVTGMNAALNLASEGYRVFLVEKSPRLGGVAATIKKTIEGEDVQSYMADLIKKTQTNPNIQVLTGSLVVDHVGKPGLFKTGLQIGPQLTYRQISHSVTILATGALANRPSEYLLGDHPAVLTQLDLDSALEDRRQEVEGWKNVVMIQCVGSRTADNPNCSRVCCQAAIKNALRILDINPQVRIIVLYRDIRTLGFHEDYYRLARQKGVIFVRYEQDAPPVVQADGNRVITTFNDPVLNMDLSVAADCLALSTGMKADDEDTEDLAAIFRLPRTNDGYFLEDHVKLKPVDLPVRGFFVAGTAHSPKSIRESIGQALAAAGRAKTVLAKTEFVLNSVVAKVDSKICAACLICVRACPFGVPFINADGYSEIEPDKCHGCGVCAAACPAKAIQLTQFEDDQILSKLYGLLEGVV